MENLLNFQMLTSGKKCFQKTFHEKKNWKHWIIINVFEIIKKEIVSSLIIIATLCLMKNSSQWLFPFE